MSKHTPGPWYTGDEKPLQNKHGARTMFGWDVLLEDGTRIAECLNNLGDGRIDPKANAALIAAAPDMLEVLEEIAVLGHEGMKPDYNEWLTFHNKIAQIADIAIAKAKGKEV